MLDPVLLQKINATLFSLGIEIMTFNLIKSFTIVADNKHD